jgi:hypothetical protein
MEGRVISMEVVKRIVMRRIQIVIEIIRSIRRSISIRNTSTRERNTSINIINLLNMKNNNNTLYYKSCGKY